MMFRILANIILFGGFDTSKVDGLNIKTDTFEVFCFFIGLFVMYMISSSYIQELLRVYIFL